MIEFNIEDSARQQFSNVINQRRVTIRLQFNGIANRWFFDLAIDGEFVLHGRKIVLGVDLVRNFNFGIGAIFAFSESGVEAVRDNLHNGTVRLFSASQSEIDAAIR